MTSVSHESQLPIDTRKTSSSLNMAESRSSSGSLSPLIGINEPPANYGVGERSQGDTEMEGQPSVKSQDVEKKEANDTQLHKHSYHHEILAIAFIIMGPVAFGFTYGFAAPAVPLLMRQKILTKDQASWFESLLPLGATFGSLVGGWMAEWLGRKTTHLLSAVPLVVGWLMILCCRSHILLDIGRFTTGIAAGILPISYGLYSAETVSKQIRGTLLMGFHAGATTGIFIEYALGLALNVQWLVVASMVPIVVLVLGTVFMPESPRWLLKKHKEEEATAALIWFRKSSHEGIKDELNEIKNNIACHEPHSEHGLSLWQDFVHSLKPIGISFSFVLLQQLSGICVVLFNIGEIFTLAGYAERSGYAIVIVGAVKLFTTLITTSVIDRFGRRPPYILGSFMMGISSVVFGFYFYYKAAFDSHCCWTWLPLMCLVVYIAGYGIGPGGIPWLILPEVMPLRFRGWLSGVAAALAWFIAFILTQEYQDIVYRITQAGLFWMFGGFNILGTVYAYFVMPETNQRSLEDIESSSHVKPAQS